ncbi:hypothetical protein L7F22_064141 [Adiantum nelumboides]|nr:hypothetical protein [Adiantum nelumboides]
MKEGMEKRRCKPSSTSSAASKSGENGRAGRREQMDRAVMKEQVQVQGANKLEKMAGWVGAGLHSAFFLSLDRCQCVKLDTLEEPILLRRPLLLSPQHAADHHNRHVEVAALSSSAIAATNKPPLHLSEDSSPNLQILSPNRSKTRTPFAHPSPTAPFNAFVSDN